MKIKAFTLYMNPETKCFDTKEMDEFMANKNVGSVWEHFFCQDGENYWAILVTYREENKAEKKEWTPCQRRLWDMLKAWRMARARQEKHPPFIILHDEALAEIVNTVPANETTLKRVRGIGESKATNYGPEIFKVIEQWQTENRVQENRLQTE